MSSHLLKKLLILISIALNFIAIFGYFYGIIPSRYYSMGWITILSAGLIYIIQNYYPLGIRLGIYINIAMGFLAFIPVFGWFAIFYGIKLCFDDVLYLVHIFDDRMKPNQSSSPTQNPFSSKNPDIIDVEISE